MAAVVCPTPFPPEPAFTRAPHPRRTSPSRRRTHDLDRLLERRGIEDEGLELPALPAWVDAPRLLQAEEISDDPIVPSPADPARVEAFGRHAGKSDAKARPQIL